MTRKHGTHHKGPLDYRDMQTVDQFTEQNVKAIMKLDAAAKANRTWSQRVAQGIATFCGSIQFIGLHVLWFGGWIAANVLPGLPHFDPYPFTFLTLVVSLEAIFLASFILISQNEETRLTERRNALDLQINLLAEQENTKMLQMLVAISRKLGIEPENDQTISVLEQATRPEQLAEQIDRATT